MNEAWLKENIWPRFSRILQRNEIYLANHSLGRPPDKAFSDVAAGLARWELMDEAWPFWLDELAWFRGAVCSLIGAPAVVPKTSAGQGLRAVLNALPSPARVVTTTAEFDSVDFILRVYESKGRASVRWVSPSAEDLVQAITPETNLVVFSLVLFGNGKLITDAEEVIKKAHSVGAKALVDVYHAAGVIPVNMQDMGADFMIGGSYKYLRGGPGACWLAYAESDLKTLDTGWFAKENPFSFDHPNEIKWGDAWMESTPAVLPVYQARAGLELVLELGVENLRQYSLQQQEFLREAFLKAGVECCIPSYPNRRGAFSLVPSTDAPALVKSLKAAKVNVDARGGNVRFCPDILNTEDEMREAAQVTAATKGSGPSTESAEAITS